MKIKVKWTGAEDYGKHVKVVLAGVGGTGKTLISSKFPNPLFASAEAGLMSVASANVPYVEIDSSQTLLDLKNALDQPADIREKMMGFPVDTLVVDTFDEVQRLLISERNRAEGNKDGFRTQDWGWLLERQQHMVRGLRNLPLNVVLTVHIKEKKNEETGSIWYVPGLQGAFADQLNEYVDIMAVLRSETKTKVEGKSTQKVQERTMQFSPDMKYPFLKDRSGTLPFSMPIDFATEYERMSEMIFANLAAMPERKEVEIEGPQPDPESVPVAAPRTAATPVKSAAKKAVAQPVKRAAKKAAAPVESTPVVEKPDYLPDGIEPNVITGTVNFFCTECGNELESKDVKNLSRIRFRTTLCQKHFDEKAEAETAEKAQKAEDEQ